MICDVVDCGGYANRAVSWEPASGNRIWLRVCEAHRDQIRVQHARHAFWECATVDMHTVLTWHQEKEEG